MQIPGFVNTGLPGKRSCDNLKYNSTVGVQKSFYLNDNIKQIAMSLDSHPIVDYPDDIMNDPTLKVEDIVDQTWARLSGSSVWLPEQKVFLSVTRIIFCPTRTRSVPKMSFLRGQLFSEDWEHLENYTLTWGERQFTFPLVFDVPTQWEQDGSLYGPEDPRIILEDEVPGAEPIIVFNMIAKRSDWKRAMYIFRPFTNSSTILTIKDIERQYTEKNWAPFFVPQEEEDVPAGKVHYPKATVVRKPNEYIHFIYSFKPLRILKCHLRCGDCEFAYEQSVPENFVNKHNEDGGSLRGGTNFVPVPLPKNMDVDPKVRVYAAFPRTNIERHCDGSFYRPEFVVMINIGSQFHLSFASESLDFGNSIIELGPEDDRCDKGRILIPNSVAHWDTSNGEDVMSITFSVNDETVQVARVQGLLQFVWDLPQFKSLLKKDGLLKGDNTDIMNMLSSWVGDDVRGCLVEAALNYTTAAQEITRPKLDHKNKEVDPSKELLHKFYQEEELGDKGDEDEEKDALEELKDDEFPPIAEPDMDHPADLSDIALEDLDLEDVETEEGDKAKVEGKEDEADEEDTEKEEKEEKEEKKEKEEKEKEEKEEKEEEEDEEKEKEKEKEDTEDDTEKDNPDVKDLSKPKKLSHGLKNHVHQHVHPHRPNPARAR